MLYKYRSLSNFQHFMDIIVNKRMYAAKFTELNDPMEGVYRFNPYNCDENVITDIRDGKAAFRILSLSKSYNNILMWSHYADGHKGVVIGISSCPTAEEINYSEESFKITTTEGIDSEQTSKEILLTKHIAWKYEEEKRIFTSYEDCYVDVEIKEIIIGKRTDSKTKELIKKIIPLIDNNIQIKDINEDYCLLF